MGKNYCPPQRHRSNNTLFPNDRPAPVLSTKVGLPGAVLLALAAIFYPTTTSSGASPVPAALSQLEGRINKIPVPEPKAENISAFDQYFETLASVIQASNPIADADKDLKASIAGVMIATNIGLGEYPTSPGLKCNDEKYLRSKVIYSLSFPDVFDPVRKRLYESYVSYATQYNREVLRRVPDMLVDCK